MKRDEEIKRTLALIEALMKGYVLTTSRKFLLKLEKDGEAYVCGNILVELGLMQGVDDFTFVPAGFNVDMKFIQTEARALSEKTLQEIYSYISEVNYMEQ